MTKIFSIALLAVVVNLPSYSQKKAVDYVNVFTGTSNSRWMLFPGATLPFGMVKLSPDNQNNVWNGGYEYTVGSISGFSHLHGMSLSGVSYMPMVGEVIFGDEHAKLFPGQPDGPFSRMWTAGYRSRYRKEDETGHPAYYKVDLLDYDIRVELSATDRCGIIRATFPESDESRLLLDFNPPTEERNSDVVAVMKQISSTEIEGTITYTNGYVDQTTVHFVSKYSHPIRRIDSWQYEPYQGEDTNYGTAWRRQCDIQEGIEEFTGRGSSGIIINFYTEAQEPVTIATGLSFVSLDNARLNMQAELEPLDYDFDRVVEQGARTWDTLLSRVEVEGKEEDKEKFYTNFYRAFTGKNLASDVNGQYVDMCEQVRTVQAPATAVYSSDALWGAHWNLFPLWTLVAPDYANSFANALIELQRHGGWLPEAPVGLEYAPIMGAQHQNALLISCYQKGIAQFDAEKVFEMIKHDYTTPGQEHPCGGYAGNRHLSDYMEYGYVSEETGPASNTMEYAYDDWCLGQFARALNKPQEADYFLERSANYQNLYDSTSGYFRRKHQDGRWYEDFDPLREGTEGSWNGPGYMEGTAWIYTWYTPHDLPSLIELIGKETFNQRLEEGFQKGYVDLGNQPNLQAPFLFNYSGKPWLTQQYSRRVVDDLFNTSPYTGWLGEEDEGQMGALCSLLSMGLFEMKGGCSATPYYDLSSPVFDKITIHLNQDYYPGETFVIEAENNSTENVFIQSASLNGKEIKKPRVLFEDMIQGGKLQVTLSDIPSEEYFEFAKD